MGRIETIADGITLYLGDCREIMSELTGIDTVVTDPVWPNCPKGLLTGWDAPAALFEAAVGALPVSTRRLVTVLRSDSDPRFLSEHDHSHPCPDRCRDCRAHHATSYSLHPVRSEIETNALADDAGPLTS